MADTRLIREKIQRVSDVPDHARGPRTGFFRSYRFGVDAVEYLVSIDEIAAPDGQPAFFDLFSVSLLCVLCVLLRTGLAHRGA